MIFDNGIKRNKNHEFKQGVTGHPSGLQVEDKCNLHGVTRNS